jgi:hypothetical protein
VCIGGGTWTQGRGRNSVCVSVCASVCVCVSLCMEGGTWTCVCVCVCRAALGHVCVSVCVGGGTWTQGRGRSRAKPASC